MSINRFALRLAAVAALTNNGKAPYPTLCGERIYDSRIDSVEALAAVNGPNPFITVYTDRSVNLWRGQIVKDSPRTVHLFIETSVAICEQQGSMIGDGEEYDISVPLTDSELETTLDIIGTQVRRALFSFEPFAKLSQGLVRVEENRAAASDGQRLAVYFTDAEISVFSDPDNGRVPDYLKPLIEKLAENPEYGGHASILEKLCTDPAALSAAEIRQVYQQWPSSIAKTLGY